VTIKASSIWVENKAMAECYAVSMNIDGGGEPAFGKDGFFDYTKGATLFTVELSFVQPTDPLSVPILEYVINQKSVTVASLVGGKFLGGKLRVLRSTLQFNTQTGRFDGTATCGGGKPSLS
jgi:hypothetical protein